MLCTMFAFILWLAGISFILEVALNRFPPFSPLNRIPTFSPFLFVIGITGFVVAALIHEMNEISTQKSRSISS